MEIVSDLQEEGPSNMQNCSACGKPFSATIKFFPGRSDTKRGIRTICRKCENARIGLKNLQKRSENIVQQPLFLLNKFCPDCNEEKPVEKFNKSAGIKDGYATYCREHERQRKKVIADRTRDRINERHHACYIANLEQRRAYNNTFVVQNRERRQNRLATDPEYREHISEYGKNYYRTHPNDPEHINAMHRKHRKENPELYAGYYRKRLAAKLGVKTGPVNYRKILEEHGPWCYICVKEIFPDQKLHYDHVIPLVPQEGSGIEPGSHTTDNIRPTHAVCNQRKSNRLFSSLSAYDKRGVDS